jgi:hypothetical protein
MRQVVVWSANRDVVNHNVGKKHRQIELVVSFFFLSKSSFIAAFVTSLLRNLYKV